MRIERMSCEGKKWDLMVEYIESIGRWFGFLKTVEKAVRGLAPKTIDTSNRKLLLFIYGPMMNENWNIVEEILW